MSEPDVEDFLAHYGVKGMKWGVRKNTRSKSLKAARKAKAKKNYTRGEEIRDTQLFGKKAAARIRKQVEAGKSKRVARTKEGALSTALGLSMGIGFLAVTNPGVTKHLAGVAMDSAIMKQNAKRGARYAANMMADSRGLTNYTTIVQVAKNL